MVWPISSFTSTWLDNFRRNVSNWLPIYATLTFQKSAFLFNNMVKKVKWSRYWRGVAQRVGRGIPLLFHDRGTRWGWVVSSTPRPHLTTGKDPVPFYRRLGGPQGRSGRSENLVPTGIQSRTVQRVVSSYTEWATGPAINNMGESRNHVMWNEYSIALNLKSLELTWWFRRNAKC